MKDKTTLRRELRGKRKELSESEVVRCSDLAQRHIVHDPAWEDARTVALYIAVGKEADTGFLLNAARKQQKAVLLPYVFDVPHGVMFFLPYPEDGQLVPNRLGIPEPLPANTAKLPAGETVPDLVIVPGVAFDRTGGRLGVGGGFYDRFFARQEMRNCLRIGLGYSFQLVDSLPFEAWDVPVHAIATEEGLLWV